MSDVSRDDILKSLEDIAMPGGSTLGASGRVSEVVIANGKVYFALVARQEEVAALEDVKTQAQSRVEALKGVDQAVITFTQERRPGSASNGQDHVHGPDCNHGADHGASPGVKPGQGASAGKAPTNQIAGIKHIIAVASGKGGVGKSTTSINLALGLQAQGLSVGVLDADVYGPSIPRLLGISGEPQQGPGGTIEPLEAYGLKAMSMGFLVGEGTPVVWRGPMVMSALTQMLRQVNWGDLDCLVIDMPPGTGDVQLTIAQQAPLSGAVIVSTPQDLALIDARKAIAMFKQVSVPITGIIENMSYFLCPSCGERAEIFGHGGAAQEAAKLGTEFLGEVPLHMDIRETADGGRPIVSTKAESEQAKIYKALAEKVWDTIDEGAATKDAPAIVFE